MYMNVYLNKCLFKVSDVCIIVYDKRILKHDKMIFLKKRIGNVSKLNFDCGHLVDQILVPLK